jgi:hypothetical protein
VHFIFYLRLEPIVNAFGVEEVIANGYFLDWNTFLILFKAYDTFILLELIHSLIIAFLLDESQQFSQSLLNLLLRCSRLILDLNLVDYILLIPSLPHAHSDNADHTHTDKDSEDYEENHGDDTQVGFALDCNFNWSDAD